MKLKLTLFLIVVVLIVVTIKTITHPETKSQTDVIEGRIDTKVLTSASHPTYDSEHNEKVNMSDVDSDIFQIYAVPISKDNYKNDLFVKNIKDRKDYLLEREYDGLVTWFHIAHTEDLKYISLTNGTYILTNTSIYSLETNKKIFNATTNTTEVFGYKNYFIFSSSNSALDSLNFDISYYNTSKNLSGTLYKGDNLNSYHIKGLNENILTISHYSVKKENDWSTNNSVKTEEIQVNLKESPIFN